MSPMDKNAWQAQVPSEGFANRATAAILQEGRRESALVLRRTGSLRWILPAAAACLLIAGAAWALTQRVPKPAPLLPVAAPPTITQEERLPVARPLASAAPPLPVATVSPRPRADAPKAALSASAAPSALSPPKVIVPPCRCNAYACECGPEL
jgi:hypothetical protein